MARKAMSLVAVAATIVMATASLSGCSGSMAGRDDGVLKVRIAEDPGTLDPHTGKSGTSLVIAGYLYDTLVGRSPEGKVVPRLATDWEVSPTSATFTIREDITCSDGTPLKPSDIAANFERLKDPKTQSPYAVNFLGSTAYTVTSDDAAGTFSIETPEPFGALLYNLSGFPRIVCAAGLDDTTTLERASHGTGPYVLEKVSPGDRYTLKAREGYAWGPEGSTAAEGRAPDTVELVVVPNDTTAANLLLSGGLDLASVDGPERARLEERDEIASQDVAQGITTLLINQAEGHPGADAAIREALVHAVDRGAMTQAGLGQYGAVADSLLLPDAPCYAPSTGESLPDFDVDAARTVLEGKGLSLKIYSIGVAGSEYVSETWRALGVDTELNVGDQTGPGMDVIFGGGDWDAVLLPFSGVVQLSTMAPILTGESPPAGSNFASVDNPTFLRLATEASASVGDGACESASEAQRQVFQNSDIAPMSFITSGIFYRHGVEYRLAGSREEAASLTLTDGQ